MKRIGLALLAAISLLFATGHASATEKVRKPAKKPAAAAPKETLEYEQREDRAERAKPMPHERKQQSDTPAKTTGRKPEKAGPPVERKLNKAASKVLDLRRLPKRKPKEKERRENELEPNPVMATPAGPGLAPTTNAVPPKISTNAAPAPILTFDGLDRFNWGSGSPPDTTGDVGPNYFIQGVNSSVGIYRKSDGAQEAAFTFDTLMSQGNFGNQCDSENFGDPVILYDTFEDRWVLTDFAFTLDGGGNVNPPEAFMCFAVSMTGDPISGGWNFYSIRVTDGLNDYPKLGIWPDGIYMSANMFGYPAGAAYQGARVWALNKQQMYAGSQSVKVVTFDIGAGDFTAVPSNARLQTGTPPPGRPNFFLSSWNFLNALTVYKFHVDWDNIPLSTFTGPDVPLSATSWPNASPDNVPQSGTANLIDAVAIRGMVQNNYTNYGGTESLWMPHTVRRANTAGFAAPRWYQVDITGGTVNPNIPQAATWDPDGANVMHRWMPSLALDRAGNMAMGYSTSSGSTFPSIAYAGRLAGDPVNTFSQTEQVMFAGTASQTTSARWGDYSGMTLDPDGCTFWYTNQYANPSSQASNQRWLTRIGAFRYPSCTAVGAGGIISGTITVTPGGAAISGATVNLGARTTTTNNAGQYSFTGIPAGTYPSITASHPGYVPQTFTSIVVDDDLTTTQNFQLGAAQVTACLVDTTQADFQTGLPANVDLTTSPGDVKLANPPTLDAQNLSLLNAGFAFTTAWHGQTFTAGVTGPLVRLDLNIFSLNCSAVTMPDVTVSIRAASGNLPTGADLATATIPGFCNGGSGYIPITFGTPATITAGTQYAIVWRTTLGGVAASPNPRYVSTVSNGDPYAGGQGASSSDGGAIWTARAAANNDHGFVVYVDTGYVASGNQVSSVKDAAPAVGFSPVWTSLAWTNAVPAGTSVQFQAAGSNNPNGPFSFVGPDGTAATFFTTSPASLTQFNGARFLQYKAYLATASGASTPTLNDVTVCKDTAVCAGGAPSITAPSSVCASTTGVAASGPAGMVNYSWSITNGTITSGLNSQNVTFNAGASGSVTLQLVVTEANGCVKQGTAAVAITPYPAMPSPSNDGPFCEGQTIQLSTATVSGATYAWTGPAGFSSALQNPTRTNATLAHAGEYSVIVTVNGCSSPAGSTIVVVSPAPATPTASNGGPYCAGQTVQLSTPTVSGAAYAWTGPNGFSSSAQNPSRANVATGDGGTYFVTITVNGCTSTAGSTSVVVNAIPATPTPGNGGPYCDTGAGVTVQLDTATVSGATYAWTGPNGFTSSAQNPARAGATPADAGSYFVTVTVNGCTSAAGSTSVVINTPPATPTASNGGPYCENQTIQLGTPAVGGATYAWTGPNGFTSALQNPTRANVTLADAGTYSVTITVDGCTSAAGSTNVVINPSPATPTATNGGPYCPGNTIQLDTPTVAGATYAWTGPNGFTSVLQNPTRAGATTDDGGTYSVTVTVNGCTSAAGTTNVVVNPTPATPTATNGGPYCPGNTIQLNTPTVAGATYAWTGPNGFTSSAQNPTLTNAAEGDEGTYSVTVTVNGCTSAAGTTNVVVNLTPATPTATNGGPYCTGNTIQLNTPTVAGATYAWTGPNGFSSALQNPTRANVVAADAGAYSVTVTVDGCPSAAGTTNVAITQSPAMPTITPGGPTSFCAGGSVTLTSSSASGNQWYLNGNPLGGETNPAYVATASGNYTVVTTADGCPSAPSAITTVTVNPDPDATITAPASVISTSTGNPASVASAGAGATYAWSITNGTITGGTGTASITFTAGAAGILTLQLTVTTAAGCSDTQSTNVTVSPLVAAVLAVVPPAGSTAGGKNVTITGTSFQSGATVTFGGAAATNVVVVGPTTITAKTPAHAAGFVDVTVTNPGSGIGTLPNGYKYVSQQFDANGDGIIDPSDIFYLVNYLFLSGPVPAGATGMDSGDGNGDGVVDPADIFYIVNYLFLSGPMPNAAAPAVAAQQDGGAVSGAITLGRPQVRGDRFIIPVSVSAAPGSAVPQAMALRVVFGGEVRNATFRRTGAARDVETAFETSRSTASALAYLVSFDGRNGGLVLGADRTAVIGEIEIEGAGPGFSVAIDPDVTLLSNRTGTRKATVAGGTLRVNRVTATLPPQRERDLERKPE